mmetsp:Transcript_7625/g.11826  ORF Transcript_7625/g.11826 Transcript_7625/m.11826 type:complete len:611 (-) Transcript_7625:41-1873(-)|eukprot:CAMPEP_0117015090 /NCGR_PEP_ID=MMETSP0472-20121206/12121_1 /TAXON_ID=693140 ORGANISM="Tiarina fusus, Strain LIS" /NCGR_SAMPLE_ID=MMETSP0472 /ASSEMBLY_ACC=CAM_ASM_000603 /LENGTH=610 /DNA_ID=CAMNT_0004718813 /DNA_START=58 /DNA_END=1890 /DNA_ORIENTATION=+
MCNSLNSTFAWVGAILVNFGFLALITWGASTLWPLGFVLCAIYTGCLYSLAVWLQNRHDGNESVESLEHHQNGYSASYQQQEPAFEIVRNEESQDEHEEGSNDIAIGKVSLPVNLLFGLAVVSFGVTCLLLPVNIVKECTAQSEPYYKWDTNVTALPEEVRSWARDEDQGTNYYDVASFAYVEETDVTLFHGTGADRSDPRSMIAPPQRAALWTVGGAGGGPPRRHAKYMVPENFVAVSTSAVCFSSLVVRDDTPTLEKRTSAKICCSDGKEVNVAKPTDPLLETGWIGQFLPNAGQLWFKLFGEHTATGNLIYSLDPQDMSTVLHSHRRKTRDSSDGGESSCDPKKTMRIQAVAILAVAALPFTLASISIWYSQQIPSMAVTTYAGLSAMYACIYKVVDPFMMSRNSEWWFGLWFAITGTVGLLLCTYFHLSESTRERSRPPLQWGLVVTGLGFGFGIFQIFDLGDDTFGDWVLLNLLVFIPLLLFGMINGNMFLGFLGSMGFLADAARLAALVGDHVSVNAREPITFIMFSLMGLAAGLLGFQLGKYQPVFQELAKLGVKRLEECLHAGADETHHQPGQDESSAEHSVSLLESSVLAGADDEGQMVVS